MRRSVRTIAYPRARVAGGERARRRPAAASSAARLRSSRSRGASRSRSPSRSSSFRARSSRAASPVPACLAGARGALGALARRARRGEPRRWAWRRERQRRGRRAARPARGRRRRRRGRRTTRPRGRRLVAEGQEVLEAPAPAREHDHVDLGLSGDSSDSGAQPCGRGGALDERLDDDDARRRKARLHGCEEVALGGGLAAGDQADPLGNTGRRRLRSSAKSPSAASFPRRRSRPASTAPSPTRSSVSARRRNAARCV